MHIRKPTSSKLRHPASPARVTTPETGIELRLETPSSPSAAPAEADRCAAAENG